MIGFAIGVAAVLGLVGGFALCTLLRGERVPHGTRPLGDDLHRHLLRRLNDTLAPRGYEYVARPLPAMPRPKMPLSQRVRAEHEELQLCTCGGVFLPRDLSMFARDGLVDVKCTRCGAVHASMGSLAPMPMMTTRRPPS